MRFPGTSLNTRYPPLACETQTGPSPPSKPSALSISSLASGARIASSAGSNLKKLVPAGAGGLDVFGAAFGACAFDKPHMVASARTDNRQNRKNWGLLICISGPMYKGMCTVISNKQEIWPVRDRPVSLAADPAHSAIGGV